MAGTNAAATPSEIDGPAFILVAPQLGENIGAACRAMWNFGLTDLRLVAPRDGWPNPAAVAMASGASRVLDAARLFETTAAAAAELTHVYATTARLRELTMPVLTPEQACADMARRRAAGERVGVLFGRERTGLENAEVIAANTVISVPVNPAFGSLNLAQCVLLIAYEWRRRALAPASAAVEPGPEMASRADVDQLYAHLEQDLDAANYFWPEHKRGALTGTLRNFLSRAALTEADARMLHGVIRSLAEKPCQRTPRKPPAARAAARAAAFDAVAVVDWSAAARPTTGRDSVWWALHRVGAARAERLENPPTRAAALEALGALMTAEVAAGRRLLIGFDFPFGYPLGAADRIAPGDGPGWARLWARLAALIEDGPDNANNRFDIAERLNREAFDGAGPFWGRPTHPARAALPERKPQGYGERYPPERRLIERLATTAQPVWKLYTTGSVGSQALMGMAALERLRRAVAADIAVAIWPFEPLDGASVALAEVYPSIFPLDPSEVVKDAAQVRGAAAALTAAAAEGALARWLAAPDRMVAAERDAVRGEEAWILGVEPD